MSVQAMAWVIENSQQKGSAFVVLLMIANHAHADGTGAYPSIDKIALESRITPRQVCRLIAKLERSKELLVRRNAGQNGTHLYSIPIWQKRLALVDTPKTFQGDIQGPQMSPEPSGTNFKEEEKSFRAPPPSEFESFWEAYPRKLGKQKAQRAWVKNLCAGHLGEILLSLTAWKELPQWNDTQFVPYPATWLNEKRFKEIPEKEQANGARPTDTSREQQRGERSNQAIERALGHRSGLADALRADVPRGDHGGNGATLPGSVGGYSPGNSTQSVSASGKELQVPSNTKGSAGSGRDRTREDAKHGKVA